MIFQVIGYMLLYREPLNKEPVEGGNIKRTYTPKGKIPEEHFKIEKLLLLLAIKT